MTKRLILIISIFFLFFLPSCDIINDLPSEPQTSYQNTYDDTWYDETTQNDTWEENTWEEDTWEEPEPQVIEAQPEVAHTGPSISDDTSELKINPKWQTKKPEARINSVWLDHNVSNNDIVGMVIHINFDVLRFKDSQGLVAAYFYFSNGSPLQDFNQQYSTYDGQVAVSDYFTPRYDDSNFADFKLFIPYDELHMEYGNYELKVNSLVWGGSNPLSNTSDWVFFTFTKQ